MYLTAQRVLHRDGREGVNAFYYLHGSVWPNSPIFSFDDDPGELITKSTPIEPPGNRVRSYLDIVTSDDTGVRELRQGFVTFVSEARPAPLPWQNIVGRSVFRIGMDTGLMNAWQVEIAELFRAVLAVRGWAVQSDSK